MKQIKRKMSLEDFQIQITKLTRLTPRHKALISYYRYGLEAKQMKRVYNVVGKMAGKNLITKIAITLTLVDRFMNRSSTHSLTSIGVYDSSVLSRDKNDIELAAKGVRQSTIDNYKKVLRII